MSGFVSASLVDPLPSRYAPVSQDLGQKNGSPTAWFSQIDQELYNMVSIIPVELPSFRRNAHLSQPLPETI